MFCAVQQKQEERKQKEELNKEKDRERKRKITCDKVSSIDSVAYCRTGSTLTK
jgi:hypothetical protein